MNLMKYTTSLCSSVRPRCQLSSQKISIARSFFIYNHKREFLNNNPFSNSSKRHFTSFFSSEFWSTRKNHQPVSSSPQNFFDSSASINKPSLTALQASVVSTRSAVPAVLAQENPIIPSHFLNLPKRKLVLNHGGSGIPKDSEKLVSTKYDGEYYSIGCGEDSFFLRYDSLGVADGVGGWRNVASLQNSVVDSSLYARMLMHYSYAELEKYKDEKYLHYNEANPVDIMQASYEQSMKDCTLKDVIGSSTALIAILRDDELIIANIGDCSIGVIRYNNYIFQTEEQQHAFNYPYQLGRNSFDTPKKDAQHFTVKIQQGDIIIMGSDGIFDNLYEDEILEEINTYQKRQKVDPQIISDSLAWKAKQASIDPNTSSPFQSRAMQEGLYYQGGKKDDISVLVAVVSDKN